VPAPPPRRILELLRLVGPGVVVAATGIGAGDLVAAAHGGATFGLALLWTALLGALLKFALVEGMARWQLATGTTILAGWTREIGRAVGAVFLVYLVVWSFVVAGALASACGFAAHALVPALGLETWAVLHALAGLAVVLFGEYRGFERGMKAIVALMFAGIVGCAWAQRPPLAAVLAGLFVPHVPAGGTMLALGTIGGVGGTVTLLSYGFWMREKGWRERAWIGAVRVDLGVAFTLTGLFGIAVMILGATVLRPQGVDIADRGGLLQLAAGLGHFGRAGEIAFLAGFWGAVASSLLGVWQGVPYLFSQSLALWRRRAPDLDPASVRRGRGYRGYALFLTFPPLLLLLLARPVWLVVLYAALGSLFMPFLAATLLVLGNRRQRMGNLRNGWLANLALVVCLGLFLYVGASDLVEALR